MPPDFGYTNNAARETGRRFVSFTALAEAPYANHSDLEFVPACRSTVFVRNPPMEIFAILVGVCLFLAIIYWIHQEQEKAKQRRNFSLGRVAAELGLRISHWNHEETRWAIFENSVFLNKGHSRYAYNVMSGVCLGRPIHAFDYHYAITTSNGKSSSTRHYHISCVSVSLGRAYPKLTVTEEGVGSKVAQFFGHDDIDFESKQFSDAYCVRSPERRFAYDVITPAMMEHLMSCSGLYFEITGKNLLVAHHELLEPQDMRSLINRAIKTRDLIPAHVMPD